MGTTQSGANGSESRTPRNAPPIDVEALIDRWVERLEKFPSARPAPENREAKAQQSRAQAPRPARGGVVRFESEVAGIPVLESAGRLVHRGSIGLRGPCAPPSDLWRELEVPDSLRIAFDHVATWYGGAFDSVNLRADAALSWGLWHLSGAVLGYAVAAFRRRAPDRCAAMLGAYGIDATTDDGARLTLRTSLGTSLHGDAAERAIASDQRLVAVLARAAREPAARAAQIEAAIVRSVRPALAVKVQLADGGPRPLIDTLQGPRQLAVALHAALAGGAPAIRVLCRSLAGGWNGGIEAYLDGLSRGRAASLLHGARRILAAAELDVI